MIARILLHSKKLSAQVAVLTGVIVFAFACESADQRPTESATQLSADELEERLTEAFSKPDPFARLTSLSAAASQLNAENAAGAGIALQKAYALVGRCESDPIVSAWTSVDRQAAVEWALAQTGSLGRNAAAQSIATWVALGGDEEALAFLRTIPSSEEKFKIVRNNIIQGSGMAGESKVAIELLGEMPADEPGERDTRQFLMVRMMLEMVRRDPEILMGWTDAMPRDAPNGLKTAAFTATLELLVRLDYLQAAEWFDTQPIKPWVESGSIAAVGSTYVLRDIDAGFAWILSQPPSEARGHAVREAAYTLLKKQPEKAYPYLRENMATEGMQPAIFALSHFYASGPPEESLKWALRVPDAREREKAILLPLMNWARREPSAAGQWVAHNEEHLSEKVLTKYHEETSKKRNK